MGLFGSVVMNFVDYFNGADLAMLVRQEMERLDVQLEDRAAVFSMLAPLDAKGPIGRFHRDHSMRVALVAVRLAAHEQIDQRAMLFAGLLHDVGKALVPGCTLAATAQWTPADAAEMEKHVVDGWRLLRDRFDFTAHVIARHHQHQSRPYPAELPKALQPFSKETLRKAEQCSWLLAVADVYDALHRINSATGGKGLDEDEIRKRLCRAFSADGAGLVDEYYESKIFPFKMEAFTLGRVAYIAHVREVIGGYKGEDVWSKQWSLFHVDVKAKWQRMAESIVEAAKRGVK